IGESTIGMTTLDRIPSHRTSYPPTRVAPTRPPMRACDDEDGNPNHQVIRFHTIAPMTPPNTTASAEEVCGSDTMPLPTVSATFTPRCAPTKLPIAARPRAARGLRARVDTDVAI